MANNPWDRAVINVRERPVSSDINVAQSQLDRSARELFLQTYLARVSGTNNVTNTPQNLFMNEGFKVKASAVPGLSVRVTAGLGFQYLPGDVPSSVGGVVGLDDLSPYKPLELLTEQTISAIPAGPGAGNSRIDIVEVRMNRVLGNSASRDVLDVGTGLFVSTAVNKTLGFTLDGSTGVVNAPASSTAAISYKVGVAGVSPVEPTVTTGYVKIATIMVETTLASVVRANIIDRRIIAQPSGMMPFTAAFSVPTGATSPPTSVTLRAPPGFEVVVLKLAPPLNNQFDVFLIGGAGPVAGNMHGSILRSSYTSTEFYHVQYAGTSFGFLTAPQVASLADATVAGPATAFPVGTPYMVTRMFGLRANTGTAVDGSIGDPALVDVQGFAQLY